MDRDLTVIRGSGGGVAARTVPVANRPTPVLAPTINVRLVIEDAAGVGAAAANHRDLDRLIQDVSDRIRRQIQQDVDPVIAVAVSARVAPRCDADRSGKEGPVLTPREQQVAIELSHGSSNRDIAERLGVSVHTVRHHTERVLAKLRVRSRAAVGRRLLDLSGGPP